MFGHGVAIADVLGWVSCVSGPSAGTRLDHV